MPPSFKNFYTGIGHKIGNNAPPDTPSLPAAPIAPPKPPPDASSLPAAPPSLPKPRRALCFLPLTSAAQAYYAGVPGASAPGEIKYKVSPFPGGEERSASAGGGMGERKQTKGRAGRRPRKHARAAAKKISKTPFSLLSRRQKWCIIECNCKLYRPAARSGCKNLEV